MSVESLLERWIGESKEDEISSIAFDKKMKKLSSDSDVYHKISSLLSDIGVGPMMSNYVFVSSSADLDSIQRDLEDKGFFISNELGRDNPIYILDHIDTHDSAIIGSVDNDKFLVYL